MASDDEVSDQPPRLGRPHEVISGLLLSGVSSLVVLLAGREAGARLDAPAFTCRRPKTRLFASVGGALLLLWGLPCTSGAHPISSEDITSVKLDLVRAAAATGTTIRVGQAVTPSHPHFMFTGRRGAGRSAGCW